MKTVLCCIISLFLLIFSVAAKADLVAQYAFDDGTYGDSSGKGFNGTPLSIPTAPAIIDDAVRGKVLFTNNSGFKVDGPISSLTNAFTLSFWVKHPGVATTNSRNLAGAPSTAAGAWQVNLDATSGVTGGTKFFQVKVPANATVWKFEPSYLKDSTTVTINDGNWHHVAMVLDPASGNLYSYLDGGAANGGSTFTLAKNQTYAAAITPLYFGSLTGVANSNNYKGWMDDIRVYNNAFAAADIPSLMLPISNRGAAHTPVPTNGAAMVDPTAVTSVSWFSPEQDALGALKDDPNIVSVDGYKYWFGTVEPNEFTQTPTSTTAQNFPVTLAYYTNYKWRVDTLVTWNSLAVTGKIKDVIQGKVWQFKTQVPTLTFDGLITTQALLPAALSASVIGFANPVSSVVFSILTGDIEYPVGAIASVTNTTTNNNNPTATLTADKAGKYKVKLVVSDGTSSVEKIVEVLVYAATDDCQARKTAGGWVANYYDRNNSCVVNLGDFAPLAAAWLNDTGILAQQTYTVAVNAYLPQSIFDARIEAESVNAIDPNWISAYPITDATGVRIVTEAGAIGGGQALGSTNATTYAQYTIEIPAAGTYDLHLYTSTNAAGNVLSFGVAGTPALYGSVSGLPNTGLANYSHTVHPGALTFSAAGPTIVRITWTGAARNLDWFTLIKQ